jgi:nucleoside-diphosphate-sugar epimerase
VHVVPTWKTHRLSLIHADDLADMIILTAKRGQRIGCEAEGASSAKGCYFISAERDVTYAEMGRMMGTSLGLTRILVVPTGPILVYGVAGLAEAASRALRKPWYFGIDKAREARAGSWTCSSAAALRDLNFRVAKTLEERFQQTVDWYRECGWL